MRALGLLLLLWWVPAVALAQDPAPAPATGSSESEAGDVSEVDKDRLGPLRERIRPVSGHLFLKKGRFEFSPSATVSLRDAFFRKYILGATITYHPLETLGVSLRAGYSIPTVSGAAQICNFTEGGEGGVVRGCSAPTFEALDGRAPGQISLIGGVDVQWAPIYGKISLLAESFASFDMYGILGASVVQYRGPPDRQADGTPIGANKAMMTPGANVGVGLRFFLNRYMTLRTEVRDLIYVENAQPENSFRNQLLFELGFSIFFPTALPES
jgi:outer membrane beta-barrel protein